MAYSDGVPRRLLDARCFPTRGGDAAQDDDDDDDGIAVSSVSVASARAARARRALATRLGTDLPELDPAGRRRAREGARRVARREEEEAAEAMRASGVIDAARAADAIVAAGIDVDEDDASEGIAATSRPYRSRTRTTTARARTRNRRGRRRRTFRGSTGAVDSSGFAHRGGGVGDARRAPAGANDDAKNDEAGNRTGDGDATRHLARTARADPRDEMRRVRITERCLWEQRGDEDGSPASSPRGTTAKLAASSSRSRSRPSASTVSPARRPARRRARRRSRRQRRGECSASRRRNPRRDFEPFSWVHPRGRRRGTSRRMSSGAGVEVDSGRPPIKRTHATRRRFRSTRRASARERSRDRRWCPRRSAARRFAGFARRRFEWLGRGMNARRRVGGAAAAGPLDLLNDAAAPGRRDREARGAMLVELGLPDVAFATVPMPARAADVVRGRG